MMQFSYNPVYPTINGFTTFTFNVLNSTTQQPLPNVVPSGDYTMIYVGIGIGIAAAGVVIMMTRRKPT